MKRFHIQLWMKAGKHWLKDNPKEFRGENIEEFRAQLLPAFALQSSQNTLYVVCTELPIDEPAKREG